MVGRQSVGRQSSPTLNGIARVVKERRCGARGVRSSCGQWSARRRRRSVPPWLRPALLLFVPYTPISSAPGPVSPRCRSRSPARCSAWGRGPSTPASRRRERMRSTSTSRFTSASSRCDIPARVRRAFTMPAAGLVLSMRGGYAHRVRSCNGLHAYPRAFCPSSLPDCHNHCYRRCDLACDFARDSLLDCAAPRGTLQI